jgi:RNA exonuclease 1
MIHEKIIDTSVIYPHPMGLPYRKSLKDLSSKFLKRIIQNSSAGHDSFEDAVASMDLVRLKIAKGPDFGKI